MDLINNKIQELEAKIKKSNLWFYNQDFFSNLFSSLDESKSDINTLNSDRFYTKKVSLSSSDILSGNTTPIELVGSIGNSEFIEVISISLKLNFGSSAYATNTDLSVRYKVNSDIANASTGILASASDRFEKLNIAEQSDNISTGTGLEVYVPTGDPTGGDSTVDLYISYKIVSV